MSALLDHSFQVLIANFFTFQCLHYAGIQSGSLDWMPVFVLFFSGPILNSIRIQNFYGATYNAQKRQLMAHQTKIFQGPDQIQGIWLTSEKDGVFNLVLIVDCVSLASHYSSSNSHKFTSEKH